MLLPCCMCRDARVMWDHNTGRSKGYGFVSFRRKEDAEAAIDLMQAKQIGSRKIRVGWAQHKQEDNSTPLDFDTVDKWVLLKAVTWGGGLSTVRESQGYNQ